MANSSNQNEAVLDFQRALSELKPLGLGSPLLPPLPPLGSNCMQFPLWVLFKQYASETELEEFRNIFDFWNFGGFQETLSKGLHFNLSGSTEVADFGVQDVAPGPLGNFEANSPSIEQFPATPHGSNDDRLNAMQPASDAEQIDAQTSDRFISNTAPLQDRSEIESGSVGLSEVRLPPTPDIAGSSAQPSVAPDVPPVDAGDSGFKTPLRNAPLGFWGEGTPEPQLLEDATALQTDAESIASHSAIAEPLAVARTEEQFPISENPTEEYIGEDEQDTQAPILQNDQSEQAPVVDAFNSLERAELFSSPDADEIPLTTEAAASTFENVLSVDALTSQTAESFLPLDSIQADSTPSDRTKPQPINPLEDGQVASGTHDLTELQLAETTDGLFSQKIEADEITSKSTLPSPAVLDSAALDEVTIDLPTGETAQAEIHFAESEQDSLQEEFAQPDEKAPEHSVLSPELLTTPNIEIFATVQPELQLLDAINVENVDTATIENSFFAQEVWAESEGLIQPDLQQLDPTSISPANSALVESSSLENIDDTKGQELITPLAEISDTLPQLDQTLSRNFAREAEILPVETLTEEVSSFDPTILLEEPISLDSFEDTQILEAIADTDPFFPIDSNSDSAAPANFLASDTNLAVENPNAPEFIQPVENAVAQNNFSGDQPTQLDLPHELNSSLTGTPAISTDEAAYASALDELSAFPADHLNTVEVNSQQDSSFYTAEIGSENPEPSNVEQFSSNIDNNANVPDAREPSDTEDLTRTESQLDTPADLLSDSLNESAFELLSPVTFLQEIDGTQTASFFKRQSESLPVEEQSNASFQEPSAPTFVNQSIPVPEGSSQATSSPTNESLGEPQSELQSEPQLDPQLKLQNDDEDQPDLPRLDEIESIDSVQEALPQKVEADKPSGWLRRGVNWLKEKLGANDSSETISGSIDDARSLKKDNSQYSNGLPTATFQSGASKDYSSESESKGSTENTAVADIGTSASEDHSDRQTDALEALEESDRTTLESPDEELARASAFNEMQEQQVIASRIDAQTDFLDKVTSEHSPLMGEITQSPLPSSSEEQINLGQNQATQDNQVAYLISEANLSSELLPQQSNLNTSAFSDDIAPTSEAFEKKKNQLPSFEVERSVIWTEPPTDNNQISGQLASNRSATEHDLLSQQTGQALPPSGTPHADEITETYNETHDLDDKITLVNFLETGDETFLNVDYSTSLQTLQDETVSTPEESISAESAPEGAASVEFEPQTQALEIVQSEDIELLPKAIASQSGLGSDQIDQVIYPLGPSENPHTPLAEADLDIVRIADEATSVLHNTPETLDIPVDDNSRVDTNISSQELTDPTEHSVALQVQEASASGVLEREQETLSMPPEAIIQSSDTFDTSPKLVTPETFQERVNDSVYNPVANEDSFRSGVEIQNTASQSLSHGPVVPGLDETFRFSSEANKSETYSDLSINDSSPTLEQSIPVVSEEQENGAVHSPIINENLVQPDIERQDPAQPKALSDFGEPPTSAESIVDQTQTSEPFEPTILQNSPDIGRGDFDNGSNAASSDISSGNVPSSLQPATSTSLDDDHSASEDLDSNNLDYQNAVSNPESLSEQAVIDEQLNELIPLEQIEPQQAEIENKESTTSLEIDVSQHSSVQSSNVLADEVIEQSESNTFSEVERTSFQGEVEKGIAVPSIQLTDNSLLDLNHNEQQNFQGSESVGESNSLFTSSQSDAVDSQLILADGQESHVAPEEYSAPEEVEDTLATQIVDRNELLASATQVTNNGESNHLSMEDQPLQNQPVEDRVDAIANRGSQFPESDEHTILQVLPDTADGNNLTAPVSLDNDRTTSLADQSLEETSTLESSILNVSSNAHELETSEPLSTSDLSTIEQLTDYREQQSFLNEELTNSITSESIQNSELSENTVLQASSDEGNTNFASSSSSRELDLPQLNTSNTPDSSFPETPESEETEASRPAQTSEPQLNIAENEVRNEAEHAENRLETSSVQPLEEIVRSESSSLRTNPSPDGLNVFETEVLSISTPDASQQTPVDRQSHSSLDEEKTTAIATEHSQGSIPPENTVLQVSSNEENADSATLSVSNPSETLSSSLKSAEVLEDKFISPVVDEERTTLQTAPNEVVPESSLSDLAVPCAELSRQDLQQDLAESQSSSKSVNESVEDRNHGSVTDLDEQASVDNNERRQSLDAAAGDRLYQTNAAHSNAEMGESLLPSQQSDIDLAFGQDSPPVVSSAEFYPDSYRQPTEEISSGLNELDTIANSPENHETQSYTESLLDPSQQANVLDLSAAKSPNSFPSDRLNDSELQLNHQSLESNFSSEENEITKLQVREDTVLQTTPVKESDPDVNSIDVQSDLLTEPSNFVESEGMTSASNAIDKTASNQLVSESAVAVPENDAIASETEYMASSGEVNDSNPLSKTLPDISLPEDFSSTTPSIRSEPFPSNQADDRRVLPPQDSVTESSVVDHASDSDWQNVGDRTASNSQDFGENSIENPNQSSSEPTESLQINSYTQSSVEQSIPLQRNVVDSSSEAINNSGRASVESSEPASIPETISERTHIQENSFATNKVESSKVISDPTSEQSESVLEIQSQADIVVEDSAFQDAQDVMEAPLDISVPSERSDASAQFEAQSLPESSFSTQASEPLQVEDFTAPQIDAEANAENIDSVPLSSQSPIAESGSENSVSIPAEDFERIRVTFPIEEQTTLQQNESPDVSASDSVNLNFYSEAAEPNRLTSDQSSMSENEYRAENSYQSSTFESRLDSQTPIEPIETELPFVNDQKEFISERTHIQPSTEEQTVLQQRESSSNLGEEAIGTTLSPVIAEFNHSDSNVESTPGSEYQPWFDDSAQGVIPEPRPDLHNLEDDELTPGEDIGETIQSSETSVSGQSSPNAVSSQAHNDETAVQHLSADYQYIPDKPQETEVASSQSFQDFSSQVLGQEQQVSEGSVTSNVLNDFSTSAPEAIAAEIEAPTESTILQVASEKVNNSPSSLDSINSPTSAPSHSNVKPSVSAASPEPSETTTSIQNPQPSEMFQAEEILLEENQPRNPLESLDSQFPVSPQDPHASTTWNSDLPQTLNSELEPPASIQAESLTNPSDRLVSDAPNSSEFGSDRPGQFTNDGRPITDNPSPPHNPLDGGNGQNVIQNNVVQTNASQNEGVTNSFSPRSRSQIAAPDSWSSLEDLISFGQSTATQNQNSAASGLFQSGNALTAQALINRPLMDSPEDFFEDIYSTPDKQETPIPEAWETLSDLINNIKLPKSNDLESKTENVSKHSEKVLSIAEQEDTAETIQIKAAEIESVGPEVSQRQNLYERIQNQFEIERERQGNSFTSPPSYDFYSIDSAPGLNLTFLTEERSPTALSTHFYDVVEATDSPLSTDDAWEIFQQMQYARELERERQGIYFWETRSAHSETGF